MSQKEAIKCPKCGSASAELYDWFVMENENGKYTVGYLYCPECSHKWEEVS